MTSGKKKRLTTTLGRITISNTSAFSNGNKGFQISALLQELVVYAGQLDCYSKAHEILGKFLSVQVSATQVFRLTDLYGEELAGQHDFTQRSQAPLQNAELLYVQAEGSMLLTGEQGFKEVKVGRVFKASDCLHPEGKAGLITHPQYLAQMSGCKAFSDKMEALIEDYTIKEEQIIFITDGAPWLRNWIVDAFPKATSILDFYHLLEHLYLFSEAFFSHKEQGSRWVEEQKELLLESKASEVMINIEGLPAPERKQKIKTGLVAYLRANQDRMDYQRYKKHRLWHYWFRGHRISAPYCGAKKNETIRSTLEQKRSRAYAQPQSHSDEPPVGQSHPPGQNQIR